ADPALAPFRSPCAPPLPGSFLFRSRRFRLVLHAGKLFLKLRDAGVLGGDFRRYQCLPLAKLVLLPAEFAEDCIKLHSWIHGASPDYCTRMVPATDSVSAVPEARRAVVIAPSLPLASRRSSMVVDPAGTIADSRLLFGTESPSARTHANGWSTAAPVSGRPVIWSRPEAVV